MRRLKLAHGLYVLLVRIQRWPPSVTCCSSLHLTLKPLKIELLLLRCVTLVHLCVLLSKLHLICHLRLLLSNKHGLVVVSLLLLPLPLLLLLMLMLSDSSLSHLLYTLGSIVLASGLTLNVLLLKVLLLLLLMEPPILIRPFLLGSLGL